MNRLSRIVHIASGLLVVQFAYWLEYRVQLLLWVLSNSLPLIFLGVWSQAAGNGQFGLSSLEFARYFLAAFLVQQLTVVWVIWDFEADILAGTLSFRLLQPIDPGWHYFINHVAERLVRSPFSILVILCIFGVYPQAAWLPSGNQLGLGLLAIALAFIFRFILQYTFAMFAFWIEQADAIERLWLLFYIFLSGLLAPLQVYPEPLQTLLKWTPLPYIIWFPASILVGLPVPLWQGLTVILGWTAIVASLNRWLWKLGLQRYSGMGA